MNAQQPLPLRVFISYSHDSPEHSRRVLSLANQLRYGEVDVVIDQYVPAPNEGWPLWMERQLDEADYVLMVCSETYHRRVLRKEAPGIGLGAQWEGNIIFNRMYLDPSRISRFIPILLGDAQPGHIPMPLQSHTHYRIELFDLSDSGYEALYRRLTDQPPNPCPELGTQLELATFSSTHSNATARSTLTSFVSPDANTAPSSHPEHRLSVGLPIRNYYFTDRDTTLHAIRERFEADSAAGRPPKQIIRGLGGVGKTQATIEYAYRHAHYYDAIFWLRADSEAALYTGVAQIAQSLGLPGSFDLIPPLLVDALRRWLETNERWLLILDNTADPQVLDPLLPANPKGHILLTTRLRLTDKVAGGWPVDLTEMAPEDAIDFILKRTGQDLVDPVQRHAAAELASELGCLPIALEHAAAYVEAVCTSIQSYLMAYRKRHRFWARAGKTSDSVAATWDINFREVESESRAAADLLRVCAFLGAGGIPEELFVGGCRQLGTPLAKALAGADQDPFAMDELVAPLVRYSLMRRNPAISVYTVHQLVQEAQRQRMGPAARRLWARRCITAMNQVFPFPQFSNWNLCQRLLPHALVILGHIDDLDSATAESAHVLYNAGVYMRERTLHNDAEPLLRQALEVRRFLLPPDHADLARSHHALGDLFRERGYFGESEGFYREALSIWERMERPDLQSYAWSLNNLALLFFRRGSFAEALLCFWRALQLRKKALGRRHMHVSLSLADLGILYRDMGRFKRAEPMLLKALRILDQETETPHTAFILHNLAELYAAQYRYEEAEFAFRRAKTIRESWFGSEHPHVGGCLYGLAGLYRVRGQYEKAKEYYESALAIWQRTYGQDHHDLAWVFHGLALVHHAIGCHLEAEPLYRKAISIRDAVTPDHPYIGELLENLADVLAKTGRLEEAGSAEARAREIFTKHPRTRAREAVSWVLRQGSESGNRTDKEPSR